MLRRGLLLLAILNSNVVAMQLTYQQLMIQAHEYFEQEKYDQARERFEKVLKIAPETSLDRIDAFKMLAYMFLKGLVSPTIDYEKSLHYAQQGYDLCKILLTQDPHNKYALRLYAQLAQYLARVYKEGPDKDWQKSLTYFEDSYNASAELPALQAATAYYLASLYSSVFALDSEYEKTNSYLDKAIELGEKSLHHVLNIAKEMLATLVKQPVTIELPNKTKRKIDLDAKDYCGSGKKLSEVLQDTQAHKVKFIIARTLVRNPNGTIGSFYCSADYLILWLWGKKAFGAFVKADDNEALQLDAKRKQSLTDNRPIIGTEFFEWDPSAQMFTYLCNDRDFFEGYTGSRKRLFILSQSYDLPLVRPGALIRLSRLYHLGLGGNKDSQTALNYLDEALKHALHKDMEEAAGAERAGIWCDLGIENETTNPALSLQNFERAALQKYDKLVSTAASIYLEKYYRSNPKRSLFFINIILGNKGIPHQAWTYYERLKEKLEKKLKAQEPTPKAEKTPITTPKKEKKQVIPAASAAAPAVPASPEPAQPSTSIEVAEPKKPEPESKETPILSQEEEEKERKAQQEIDILQKKERSKSLFKEFEERLEIYSNNPSRIAYLKDARAVLEQIKALNIEEEKAKISKAENKITKAFSRQAEETTISSSSRSSSTSSSSSATSAALIVLDLFEVENNIPDTLKKRFKEIKTALAYDSHCCEAEGVESSKYGILRVRLGDYRLLYVITSNFIGLLGVVPRDESTYKKVDPKYKNKVKEYTDLAAMDSTQLNKRIEEERKLGREETVKALTDLLNSMKKN